MRESLLCKLVLVLSRATPEKLAAVYQFATGEPLESAETELGKGDYETTDHRPLTTDYKTTDHGPQDHGTKRGNAETLTRWDAESKLRYVFRWTGRHWEVIFAGGRAFRLRNTLGARYLDYFLHNPNEPIHSFDLEVQVQPEKGEARVRDTLQPKSDAQALREYRQELRRLQMETAQRAGEPDKVAGLEAEMEALKSALKGAGAADTGERAFDNVRKALRVVQEQLRNGGPEEQAFAEHLRTHLSIGFECLYTQPQGRIWG
jgi:hypothetical protein